MKTLTIEVQVTAGAQAHEIAELHEMIAIHPIVTQAHLNSGDVTE